MYADLRKANLRGIWFKNSNLMFADLRGADLTSYNGPDHRWLSTWFFSSDLSMANLKGADLRHVRTHDSNFIRTILDSNTRLTRFDRFSQSNFIFARNLPSRTPEHWRWVNICPDGTSTRNNLPCSDDQLIPLV